MIEVIKSFSSILNGWEIIKYEKEGNSFRFIAEIRFKDNSKLFVKEYYFETECETIKNNYFARCS